MENISKNKKKRGLASAPEETRREVAKAGEVAASYHKWTAGSSIRGWVSRCLAWRTSEGQTEKETVQKGVGRFKEKSGT
jgi:hypothetical protein